MGMESPEKTETQEEESPEKTETQEELLIRMERIDKEIQEVEQAKAGLYQRQQSLIGSIKMRYKEKDEKKRAKEEEESQKEELKNEDPEVEYRRRLVERFSYKNTDLIKQIYKENRERAKAAHQSLFHLNYNNEDLKMPLYNQPSDLVAYHENIEKYKIFRPKLIKFLQMKRLKEIKMEQHMDKEFRANMTTWIKKMDKFESNPKRKHRQQRARAFYEREFPEIKKQREQQERFERLGSRSVGGFIRSEAEVAEIADNLREKDATTKQMHLLAVSPPYLLSKYERRIKYINTNGLIRNLEQFEKERKASIIWSEDEKQLFREKFALFPKDFEKISSFLKMKNCSDCVLFYYQNKKKEYFKSSKLKKKKKGKANRAGAISLNNKQKPLKPINKDNIELEVGEDDDDEDDDSFLTDDENQTSNHSTLTTNKISVSEIESKSILNKPAATQQIDIEKTTTKSYKSSTQIPIKIFNTRSGKFTAKANAIAISAATSTATKTNTTTVSTTTKACTVVVSPIPTVTTTDSHSNQNKQPAVVLSTAETPKPPLKITIVVTSPSNFGDSTSSISVASIVSETVTAAGILADQTKTSVIAPVVVSDVGLQNEAVEVKVEELIKQHLTKMPEHSDPSRWSENEMMKAVDGLKRFGRNWQAISKLVETKSEAQCKNFYFNYKKKFNLESILGICKTKEKEDLSELEEEDLIPYLEELERLDELEKQQKQDGDKQKAECKPAKVDNRKGIRCRSVNKSKSTETNKLSVEVATPDNAAVQKPEESTDNATVLEREEIAAQQPLAQASAVDESSESKVSPLVEYQDAANRAPRYPHAANESTLSQDGVLRPPPPLVTYHPSPVGNVIQPPIRAVRLPDDVARQLNAARQLKQKSEFSLEKERLLHGSPTTGQVDNSRDIRLPENSRDKQSPEMISQVQEQMLRLQLPDGYPITCASQSIQNVSQDGYPIVASVGQVMQNQDGYPVIASTGKVIKNVNQDGYPVVGQPMKHQYLHYDLNERQMKPELITVPQSVAGSVKQLALGNPNMTSMEQNVAIQAFSAYSGYMSLPPPQASSPADLPSPRFHFQVSPSPSNIPSRMPIGRNVHQRLPLRMQHPGSMGVNIPQASHSPVMSNLMETSYNSPAKSEILFSNQLEEIKRQREIEMFHRQQKENEDEELKRQREIEMFHRQQQQQKENQQDISGLVLRHEIEAERDAQLKFRQKEIEMQHMEAQYRQQEELKYRHLQKLEFDRRQEEIRQREIEKQKEMEMHHQRRLFAEKLMEHGHMSQDMVLALMQRHFGQFDSPEQSIDNRTGSQEDLHKFIHDNAREQYLTKLPHHPRTRSELHQRAASIPDLRTNPPAGMSEPYLADMKMRHTRIRTSSGPDHKSVIPEDKSQEFYSRQQKLLSFRMVAPVIYDKFVDLENSSINIPDVPLEPLSRPGSAGAEMNESKLGERTLYGISTGLARKPPPLTSISGGLSKTPPGLKIDKSYSDGRHSRSPHDLQSQVLPGRKAAIETESMRRKSTIVRPWETGPDAQAIKTPPLPPPPLSSTKGKAKKPQLIQLAATSTQFKEQIINLAQKNSPAPEKFPKFHFSTNPDDKNDTTEMAPKVNKRSARSSSEISLSPTYPMPNRSTTESRPPPLKSAIAKHLPPPPTTHVIKQTQDDSTPTRPRSDSEETISADEYDTMQPPQTHTTSTYDAKDTTHVLQTTQLQKTPLASTLLMKRLTSNSEQVSSNVPSPPEESTYSELENMTSNTEKVDLIHINTEVNPLKTETLVNISPTNAKIVVNTPAITVVDTVTRIAVDTPEKTTVDTITRAVVNTVTRTVIDTPVIEKNIITVTESAKPGNVVTSHSSDSSTAGVPCNIDTKVVLLSKESIETPRNTSRSNISKQPIIVSDKVVQPKGTVKKTRNPRPTSQKLDAAPNSPNISSTKSVDLKPFQQDGLTVDKKTLDVKTSTTLTKTPAIEPVESLNSSTYIPSNESFITQPGKKELKKQDSITSELVDDSVVVPTKVKERTESPDIYDDLKVHDYDEHASDSPNDLYSDMKPETNEELMKLTAIKDSPQRDIELFYTSVDAENEPETSEASDEPLVVQNTDSMLVKDNKDDKSEDDEITQINTSSEEKSESRTDVCTPVQDEPQFVSTVAVTTADDKTDEAGTPGSTPEAKTPLMDEPEYSFEPIQPATKIDPVDYLKYTNQPAYQIVSEETKASDSLTRLGYLNALKPQHEAFESITPPSSPEPDQLESSERKPILQADLERKLLLQPSTTAPQTSVAFPFSALAFSVGSRPGSRSSGSCHSPDDRSPRNETDPPAGGRNKQRRSREHEDESDLSKNPQFQNVDVKRMQNRNYRRSGSQSSSSSFSKSPEYEYKSRMQSSIKSSPKPRQADSKHQESSRKQKRSSPPSDHTSHSKKSRT